jgi:tetratricopeptide (TPR) repeat protein
MELDGFLDELDRRWPKPEESASKEIIDFCQAALSEHPRSSTLWYDLGILMQRCKENDYKPEDYLRCLENAVQCNGNNWQAQEELGDILDTYFEDFTRAEKAFRRAIELGAGFESYCGLARVLAQTGKISEAIHVLSKDICPFHDHDDIQALRAEIVAGEWYWES